MRYGKIILCLGFILPSLVFGQVNDEFIVRVLVGTDDTPPTTPVISQAVPMSPYQIDITWGAATDDTSVEGYRLYRDGMLVATTTFLTYIDTGLTPSTTYSYTVDAFDYSMNVSSTSLAVATTTLSLPPVATTTPTTTPSAPTATAVPALRDIDIKAGQNDAHITFSSYGPTRYLLRFGQTTEYELGSVSSNLYGVEHVSRLQSLEPGTTYYFELTLFNNFGVKRIVTVDSFTTQPAVMSQVPVSVYDVRGLVRDSDAVLTWRNPATDFRAIRIVRSHLFYPQNPTDGVVVYEGEGTNYTDDDVFLKQDGYYYSIFVIADDGRVSAPAVVFLEKLAVGSTTGGPVDTSSGTSSSTATGSVPLPVGDVGIPSYLMPSDVFVIFGNTTRTLDSLLPLPIDTEVLVSIPYEAVSPHLKTILLSVYHPTDHTRVTTYLLKLRGDGTAYDVYFHSSPVEGEGRLVVEVFDYENESVRRLSRTVTYVSAKRETAWAGVQWLGPTSVWVSGLLLVGFFLSFWWVILWWRRRREDNH